MLDAARQFFRMRGVLEVDTPAALSRTVTDVQIESITAGTPDSPRYLQTSPEYPMKRLLAAGSGDIYQICRVFRAGEYSRLHNPEFTLVEWYRQGFSLADLMAETASFAATLLAAGGRPTGTVETLSYQAAFRATLGLDPLEAATPELLDLSLQHGLAAQSLASLSRDDLLDFLVASVVGPQLGRNGLTCLHHYPASQAALARLDEADPRTALRFELYADGVELANGYVELGDASEQRRRFEGDLGERRRRALGLPEMDERLLAALVHGLPACAGVALGFDRVVMLAAGASHIDAVLPFSWDRA